MPVESLLRNAVWNVAEQPLNKQRLIIFVRFVCFYVSYIHDSTSHYKIATCIYFLFLITVFTAIALSISQIPIFSILLFSLLLLFLYLLNGEFYYYAITIFYLSISLQILVQIDIAIILYFIFFICKYHHILLI